MAKSQMSFREQIQGFPIWQISVTSFIRIVEPIAFTSLFPYVYFMVRDFHIAKTEAEISKYVGYLASCFSFSQFISSIQWGMTADKIGRKPVLIIGLSGSAIGMLLFGFSKNYWQALGARIMMGFLNGNTGVLRTVIGENCKEKKHQALALSSMPFLYQTGSILGPIVGGLLTNASDNVKVKRAFSLLGWSHDSQYNVRDTAFYKLVAPIANQSKLTSTALQQLIEEYPYALSNVVLACAFSVSITACFLFLEETHPVYKHRRDYGLDLGDQLRRLLGFKPPRRSWHSVSLEEDAEFGSSSASSAQASVHAATENFEEDEEDSLGKPSLTPLQLSTVSSQVPKNVPAWRLLFSQKIRYLVVTQVVMSVHNTVYSEFFPVFLARRTIREGDSNDLTSPIVSRFPFKIVGGMGFDSVQVGKILSGTGFIGMFAVAVIFPYVDRKLPAVKAFRRLSILYLIIYFFMPFMVFTVPPAFTPFENQVLLYCLTFTRVIASGTTVPFIVLLTHRCAPPHQRAFVNGAFLSISALARFTGPLVWGNIMSYAESVEKGWITWWSLLVMVLATIFMTFKLKDDEEEEDEVDFDLAQAEQEEEELEQDR